MFCSPQTRGCTDKNTFEPTPEQLFPADAGMYRHDRTTAALRRPVPRRRGDVPPKTPCNGCGHRCSPQTRGCTELAGDVPDPERLFPADAGMYRSMHSETAI